MDIFKKIFFLRVEKPSDEKNDKTEKSENSYIWIVIYFLMSPLFSINILRLLDIKSLSQGAAISLAEDIL